MNRRGVQLLCVLALAGTALVGPTQLASARSATAPLLPTSVLVGTPVTVTGTVAGGKRIVDFQRYFATGWRKVASTTSSTAGKVSFKLNTSWYGAHTFRFFAPKTKVKKAWISPKASTTVRPAYTPVGPANAYTLFGPGRWNPCEPIPWTYSPGPMEGKADITGPNASFTGIQARAVAVAKSAVAEIGRATGFKFKYQGATAKVKGVRGRLSVGWESSSYQDFSNPYSYGVAGPHLQSSQGHEWEIIFADGHLNAFAAFEQMRGIAEFGETSGTTAVDEVWDMWRGVWMHELTHAMNVDHSSSPTQLMYPTVEDTNRLEKGDLAALRKIGADRGCIKNSYR